VNLDGRLLGRLDLQSIMQIDLDQLGVDQVVAIRAYTYHP
jgi:hypothetical protein